MPDIVSLFGSYNVFVLSVEENTKVPIGVTAVTKQAPLIMHVSYEIRLPDHDFVKATPSGFKSRNNLLYVYTDGRDFDQLVGLKEFNKIVKHENTFKLIVMFFFMEVQRRIQDSQKHWTFPCSILRNTIWMRY